MGKNYSKTIYLYNATFKLCPKNKNQKKHSMEVWITFSVYNFKWKRKLCFFQKKKKNVFPTITNQFKFSYFTYMYIWFTWNNLSLFILIKNKIIYITLYIDTIMDNTATSILIIKKDTNILLSLGRG